MKNMALPSRQLKKGKQTFTGRRSSEHLQREGRPCLHGQGLPATLSRALTRSHVAPGRSGPSGGPRKERVKAKMPLKGSNIKGPPDGSSVFKHLGPSAGREVHVVQFVQSAAPGTTFEGKCLLY